MEDTTIALPSAVMQEIYRQVGLVASTNATVLITGETGVGKEVIATKIHHLSLRNRKPFKATNCSTFPDNGMLQSELFGHEKGAFTGANAQRAGLFEQTNKGTLFLDEIGEMNLEVQTMFLRVLETQEFTRLGGNKAINVDVRVITATNKHLETAVANREFREDLYYRLNHFHIHIPALRERREDIPFLVDTFISQLSTAHKKRVTGIAPKALQCLTDAPWPGNIRQLRNALERTIIVTKTEVLEFGDLPADIVLVPQAEPPSPLPASDTSENAAFSPEVSLILARLSVIEFISIFAGIPIFVWRLLPETTQQAVIKEASFHLSRLLGRDQNVINTRGLDRDGILRTVAQQRIAEYGSLTQAAKSLGVDRRTFKTYLEKGDEDQEVSAGEAFLR